MVNKKNKRKSIGVLIWGMMISWVMLFGCQSNESSKQLYRTTFLGVFDTVTSISGFDTSEKEFEEKAEFIKTELERFHQLYDIYFNYEHRNNIKTINDQAGGEYVEVDPDIVALLNHGLEIYDKTHGKTNIFFGNVTKLWKEAMKTGVLPIVDGELRNHCSPHSLEIVAVPQGKSLEEALLNGKNKLQNKENEGKNGRKDSFSFSVDSTKKYFVKITDSMTRIDVGAIAKGFSLERVMELYSQKYGGDPLLINIGGNVRVLGDKIGASKTNQKKEGLYLKSQKGENEEGVWKIGIEYPKNLGKEKNSEAGDSSTDNEETGMNQIVINAKNVNVATCGNQWRYFEQAGKKYGHVISVETLMPVDLYYSVTVVASNDAAQYADGLSTALFTMNQEEGMALIESLDDMEALFIHKDGTYSMSSGIGRY